MKNSMIDSIKSLPPLPKTVIDMQRVCNDPESSINDLVKTVEHDPMIVANLLKAANSPLYSLRREINTVAQAVSLFGMSMTRSIGLGNSVRKLLNVDMEPYGVSSDRFAEISAMQAMLVHKWFAGIDRNKADKLFLAAFLQEMGKIVIASDVIQLDLTTNFKSDIEVALNISMVERSYVEATTAEVSAVMFTHWNFDRDFIQMIEFSDAPKDAPEGIKEYSEILNVIKTVIPVGGISDRSVVQGIKKAQEAGLNVDALQKAIDTLLENIA